MEAHLNSFFDFLIMLSISPETRLYSSSAALEEGIQPIGACKSQSRAIVVGERTEAANVRGRKRREGKFASFTLLLSSQLVSAQSQAHG